MAYKKHIGFFKDFLFNSEHTIIYLFILFLNNKKICWHVRSATLHHRVLKRKTIPDYRYPTYSFQIQSFWTTNKNKPDDFVLSHSNSEELFPKLRTIRISRHKNSWSSSVVHVNCISIMVNQDVNSSLPASNIILLRRKAQ